MIAAKNKINILLVDDHPDSLVALEATLDSPNYNIVKALSGEEALRALLKLDFALILLDVQMPNLNGFEIAKLIRQREKSRHIPIIFITGFNKDTESISEGYLAGAVDYLMKPVDPDIIRAKSSFFIDVFVKNESLRQAGKHFERLGDIVKIIVWRADARTLQFTYVTKEAEKILGYSTSEWTSSEEFWKRLIFPDDRERIVSAFHSAVQRGMPAELEYRMVAQDGRIVWFQNMLQPPQSASEANDLVGIMVEITERKQAEEAIRKANEELEWRVAQRTSELRKMLEEKEVLLKEIHHRVKNNLQIISSLLKLQKKYISNEDGWHALDESQNRVLSMALIHEKLYDTTDFTEINFAVYMDELATHLFESYGIDLEKIKLAVHSDVFLTIDTAIPCGLIVNELVSNSLKYAFPEGRTGEISIALQKDNGKLLLTVKDDGAGLPKDLDIHMCRSLGLKLVNSLANQLKGTLEVDSSSGTKLSIAFPEPIPQRGIAS